MDITLTESHIEIKVALNIYNIEILHKCFYWYGDRFSVEIDIVNENIGLVKLYPKNFILNNDRFERTISQLRTDLIDFKTRDIVTRETKNIRELLIAKAFAHSDEFDAIPTDQASDSIGFDPSV